MKKVNNYDNELIINYLIDLLNGGNSHSSLEEALNGINFILLGRKIASLPYSIWQLTEHVRISQNDILEFSRNENHKSPKWPDEYWPKEFAPESELQWEECLQKIQSDLSSFTNLLKVAKENLFTPFSYGTGQTLFKEAIVLADHNSYHTGEIIVLRRLLNDWK